MTDMKTEPVAWRYHDEYGVSRWFDGAPDQISIDFVASRGGCIELSFSKAVEQPAPVAVVHTMKSIMEAVEASRCYTVLTSDQCHALAQSLNGVNK